MDVFEAGHQFGDFEFQLNDHNPGVSESGIFWTMSIPKDSVRADLSAGRAEFCLSDALMPDQHDLLTTLWGGGEFDGEGQPLGKIFPSTVSLDARWFGAGSTETVRDPVNRFLYINAMTNASIKWRSVRRGVRFESDGGPQTVVFAAIGKERNGSFF
jgi:hypothetical protein